MENRRDQPPVWAQRFLLSFLRHDLAEEVLGDLDEFYHGKLNGKPVYQKKWRYWLQVAKYLRPFAVRKFNRYPIIQTDMFRNYLHVSLRNLMKNKLFSLINIGGMALSLTSVLLIALFLIDSYQYDAHVADVDQKYRVYTHYYRESGDESEGAMVPPMVGATLRTNYPEVDYVTRFLYVQSAALIKAGNVTLTENRGGYADPTIFDMFSLQLREGDRSKALQEPNQIAVSETMRKKYFGDEPALGKTLEYFGDNYQVVAVFEDFDTHSHFQMNYFISIETLHQSIPERMKSWGWSQFHSYVKLKEGADPRFLESKFNGFLEKDVWPTTDPHGFHYVTQLMPMRDIHLKAYNHLWDIAERGNIQTIYILSGLGAFILLISILNFVNLSTARAINRTKEVGVRKVAGAYRSQLIFQFTSEAVITAMLALVIALAATWLLLPALNDFLGRSMDSGELVQPLNLLVMVGGTMVVGVLAGVYPAFMVSGYQPAGMLGKSAGARKALLRESLVVMQFAISFVLIMGAWVVNDQHAFMRNTGIGFQKDNIVVMRLRDPMYRNIENVKEQFEKVEGVETVSLGYGLPGEAFAGDGIMDQKTKKNISLSMLLADEDFLPLLKLDLIAGRNFSKDNPADEKHAFIISEELARQLGYTNPADALQHPLAWPIWGAEDSVKNGVVVGVIKDMQLNSMRDKIGPVVLHMHPREYSGLTVRISPHNVPATISRLEDMWKTQGTAWPFEFHFLDDNYDRMYKSEERLAGLFSAFSSFTILVACMGLFGLVMYSTSQRFKEIGIRKVMGANEGGLVVLLSKNYMKLLLISFALAMPLSYWAASEWLTGFMYHISLSAGIFLKSAAVIVALALLTVGFLAMKASRANPVNVLRAE